MNGIIRGPEQTELFPATTPQYLIDTNCLITPYNEYYNPDFMLSTRFWDRMFDLTQQGLVGVLDKVRDETYDKEGSDELNAWLNQVALQIIKCESNPDILAGYQDVMQKLGDHTCGYQPHGVRDWAEQTVADPWLIGASIVYRSSIITFEKRQNENDRPWKHPKIPTVASMFGVECIDLFAFMEKTGGF
jgi:hypothetical protein